MSSLTDASQGNLKRVLRTALVGVKPADQVMLKGYLRVVLRLEADLEWVSANHAQVDLFMIGNEFREADSVKKLLSTQADKPVLYVARTNAGEGSISGDTIVLPLKRVNELSDWLARYVTNLGIDTAQSSTSDVTTDSSIAKDTAKATVDNSSGIAPKTSQAAGGLPAKAREQNPRVTENHETKTQAIKETASKSAFTSEMVSRTIDAPTSSSVPPKANVGSISPQETKNYQSMIDLVQTLQQGPQGLFELIVKDAVAALIEPSTGRLWQTEHTAAPVLSLEWQLKPYQGARPDDKMAQDLPQWLWNRAWTRPNDIMPLISDTQTYHLRYWIKPRNSDDRRELLRLMTALEMMPRTVSELATVTETTEKIAKKALAGLLFSGSLQAQSYTSLAAHFESTEQASQGHANPPAGMAIGQSATSSPVPQPEGPVEAVVEPAKKLSPLESVLARREQGESATLTTSTYDSDVATQAEAAQPLPDVVKAEIQQEKKGFLSRLRSKLGL